MPIGPKLSMDWARPENASVFDPLYKTLARKAVNGLGLNDPSTTMLGMAAPLELPLSAGKALGSAASPFLENLFSKIPGARGAYEKAMQSQLGQVLTERAGAKAARAASAEAEMPALRGLEQARGNPSAIPAGVPPPELSTIHPNGMFLGTKEPLPRVAGPSTTQRIMSDPQLIDATKFSLRQ